MGPALGIGVSGYNHEPSLQHLFIHSCCAQVSLGTFDAWLCAEPLSVPGSSSPSNGNPGVLIPRGARTLRPTNSTLNTHPHPGWKAALALLSGWDLCKDCTGRHSHSAPLGPGEPRPVLTGPLDSASRQRPLLGISRSTARPHLTPCRNYGYHSLTHQIFSKAFL